MNKLKESFVEVIMAVLPIAVVIIILGTTLTPFTTEMMVSFLAGCVMMIFGMALFLFGADISMMEVGKKVGNFIIKKKSLFAIVFFGFIVGFAITMAEPDVQILANQVNIVSQGGISKNVLIAFVSAGVGIFVVIGFLRIVFQVRLTYILLVGYIIIFSVAYFANPNLVPVAFDSGGVTTGPMTVPFILALANGITSSLRKGKNGDDNFGMVGLASLGPILAVMIMAVIFK